MDFGRICIFNCRCSTERKDKNKITIGKYFVCSRAGSANNLSAEDSNIQRRRMTVSAKCSCNAKIIIESVCGGRFSIKTFVEKHNHLFAGK